MKTVRASVTCARCGRYTEVTGADIADAQILLWHAHGHDYNHPYDGTASFHTEERRVDTCDDERSRKLARR